jgi:putative transposase
VTKAVLERALAEEMSEHLGYDKHDAAGRGSGNSRNGIALSARGLTTRDIRAHLGREELQDWQARPLDRVYPVVFIDALMVKIRGGVGGEPAGYGSDPPPASRASSGSPCCPN